MTKYSFSRQNVGEYVFVKFCRLAAEMARDGQPIVSFDYSKAFDEVRDKRPPIVVTEAAYPKSPDATPPVRVDFAEILAGLASGTKRPPTKQSKVHMEER